MDNNNLSLPQLSEEFTTNLQKFFQLYELNSAGFANVNAIEKEWPTGIPGLPEKTLYFLRLLSQQQNGLFSYRQMLFSVKFLTLRKYDNETLHRLVNKLHKVSSNKISHDEFIYKSTNPKPATMPRKLQTNCTNNSTLTKRRSTDPLNGCFNVYNVSGFSRSQSMQDIMYQPSILKPKYVNCVSTNENKNSSNNDRTSDTIQYLISENQKLSNEVESLRQEVYFYKKLVDSVEKEKSILVQNLLAYRFNTNEIGNGNSHKTIEAVHHHNNSTNKNKPSKSCLSSSLTKTVVTEF